MKGHKVEDLTNRAQSQHTGKQHKSVFIFEILITKQTSLLYETENQLKT